MKTIQEFKCDNKDAIVYFIQHDFIRDASDALFPKCSIGTRYLSMISDKVGDFNSYKEETIILINARMILNKFSTDKEEVEKYIEHINKEVFLIS